MSFRVDTLPDNLRTGEGCEVVIPRHKNSHVFQALFRRLRRLPVDGRSVLLVPIYVLAGLALEEVSTVFNTADKITPWNPSSGLHFVLLLGFGLRYTPALLLVPLLDGLVVQPMDIAPAYVFLFTMWFLLGYGAASTILLHQLHIDPRLDRFRDVFWFAVVAAFVVPFVVSVFVVTTLTVAGTTSWSIWGARVLHEWAGEATGIAMLAPPLLILLRAAPCIGSDIALDRLALPINLHWPRGREALEWGVEIFALVFFSCAAYYIPSTEYLNYTYLVFLPLIWIAVRHGFERAALAVLLINISVVMFVNARVGKTEPLAL